MSAGEKIRVLIADDSAFMRKVLLSILAPIGGFEVVGEARDGREAVEKRAAQAATSSPWTSICRTWTGCRRPKSSCPPSPRPIVIVSSESRDGAEATLRALELGAIDFVAKPTSAHRS